MTYGSDGSSIRRGDRSNLSGAKSRGAIVWILVAFAFLILGLAGGAVLSAFRKESAWLIPAAGFVGYLLAFRRGMLLRNPAVDRSWRRYVGLEPEVLIEDERNAYVSGEYPENTLKILRPGAPRTQRHEMRLVR